MLEGTWIGARAVLEGIRCWLRTGQTCSPGSINPAEHGWQSWSFQAEVFGKHRPATDTRSGGNVCGTHGTVSNMEILGHCTGRLLGGRGRPQSEFDHAAVFAECKDNDVAVEINSRPERKDPPRNLLNWPSISAAVSQSIPMHMRDILRQTSAGPRRRVWCHRRPRDQYQSGRDVVELERLISLAARSRR